jgi:hypothetical protein
MSPDFGQHTSVVEATLARAGHTAVEGAHRQNYARCLGLTRGGQSLANTSCSGQCLSFTTSTFANGLSGSGARRYSQSGPASDLWFTAIDPLRWMERKAISPPALRHDPKSDSNGMPLYHAAPQDGIRDDRRLDLCYWRRPHDRRLSPVSRQQSVHAGPAASFRTLTAYRRATTEVRHGCGFDWSRRL